jgi:hypothetical protein
MNKLFKKVLTKQTFKKVLTKQTFQKSFNKTNKLLTKLEHRRIVLIKHKISLYMDYSIHILNYHPLQHNYYMFLINYILSELYVLV